MYWVCTPVTIIIIISLYHSVFCSVFLIDHAWTYETEFARTQLRTIPGLARRMASLMDLTKDSALHSACQNEEKQPYLEESLKISAAEGFYTSEDGTVLLHIHFQYFFFKIIIALL